MIWGSCMGIVGGIIYRGQYEDSEVDLLSEEQAGGEGGSEEGIFEEGEESLATL